MSFDYEQAWANRRKIIAAAIRLRHSVNADNEIKTILLEEKAKFDKLVLSGKLPEQLSAEKVLRRMLND